MTPDDPTSSESSGSSAASAPRPARGLVARLYLFGLAQVLVVALTVPWLARLTTGASTEPAELSALVRRVVAASAASAGDAAALRRELAAVRAELRGEVSVFDSRGGLVATNTQPPLAPPPGFGVPSHYPDGPQPRFERRSPMQASWFFLFGAPRRPTPRFVVLLPGPLGGYGVYGLSSTPYRLPGGAWALLVALVGCAVSAVLLARSFASPLTKLAATARAFGGGDLAARSGLARRDEFGELGRAFDAMAGRVSRLIRAQSELLANVSHELRTPLARMRVALDLAAEGDASTAREALAEITEDLDELERLVADVLASARLDADGAGTPPLRREPVEVRALLERSAGRFASRHPGRSLELEAPDDAGSFDVDPALLRRALDNVLDNAANYSDPGAPVTVRARAEGPGVVLEVEDRGIGLAPEDLARVGTPFFRTDQSRARATGGVGLGLALARRVAEAHGGSLALESERGVGTRVRITVPRLGEARPS